MSADNILVIAPNTKGPGFCMYDVNFSDLSSHESWYTQDERRAQAVTKLMADKYQRVRQGTYPTMIEALAAANRYIRTWPVEYGISTCACQGSPMSVSYNGSQIMVNDLMAALENGSADPKAVQSLVEQLTNVAFPGLERN